VISDTATATEANADRPSDLALTADCHFHFVPGELAARCRKLIEGYHAIYGYASLPDMLWQSDARDVIEHDGDLMHIFKKACKSRGGKPANRSFLFIATAVVSLEVLARDLASWGKRFPQAQRKSAELVGDAAARQRIWLVDMYLYPSPNGARKQTSKPVG